MKEKNKKDQQNQKLKLINYIIKKDEESINFYLQDISKKQDLINQYEVLEMDYLEHSNIQ